MYIIVYIIVIRYRWVKVYTDGYGHCTVQCTMDLYISILLDIL